MWLDKHARHGTLTHPRVLPKVCSRGIGFQPVTVFMTLVRRFSWLPSFCFSSRTGWKPIPRALVPLTIRRQTAQHREGRIDDCRVMIVEVEELGRVPRHWLRVKRGFAFGEQYR